MEDNKIWFYIIAAVIYFLTRKKKKKNQPQPNKASRPTEANRPQQQPKPVSFEDLLKDITEGRTEEAPEAEVIEEQSMAPVYEERPTEGKTKRESIRHFADEESRRVYEASVARAAEYKSGHDHKFEPDEDYISQKMFKKSEVDSGPTIADEIREGLHTTDNARKAIVYSEILNRKY